MNEKKYFPREFTVRWADVDSNQHCRHSVYADYATHIRMEWFHVNGISIKKMILDDSVPVMLEDSAKYFSEVHLCDVVSVNTELVGVSDDKRKYHVRHVFKVNEKTCVIYEMHGTWMSPTMRKSRAPSKAQADLLDSLERSHDFSELASRKKPKTA